MKSLPFGSNVADSTVQVELRFFNSLVRYNDGRLHELAEFRAGSTVGDVLRRYRIPAEAVHIVWINGRDITAGLNAAVNTERALDEGDVVALSGPVPYSWGYGAPVL